MNPLESFQPNYVLSNTMGERNLLFHLRHAGVCNPFHWRAAKVLWQNQTFEVDKQIQFWHMSTSALPKYFSPHFGKIWN